MSSERARRLLGVGEGDEAASALATWDRPGMPARSAAELVETLDTTWRVMQEAMARWAPVEWAQIYEGEEGDNREAAEDITADVFIKVLAHLDLTREERSIVAWLFRVARNAVHDHWRAGHGAPVIQFAEADQERRQEARPDPAREAQTAARAGAVLAALPHTYRSVLTYRLLDGLSVTETAQRMGITTGNVKVMQHHALRYAADSRAPADAGRPASRRRRRSVVQ